MAEWLYEEGIGENRAALVEDGQIVEAAIELPAGLRHGAVVTGRLAEILIPGRRGLVVAEKEWISVEPLPPVLTKGQIVRVEILREAIAEPGHGKYARGRTTDEAARAGPSLAQRIGPHRALLPTDPDLLEEAGWTELQEEAISGEIAFPGGNLRMSLTPAMTLFDIDGSLAPVDLAVAGAAAVGRAIRRLCIGGSIGVDLPTLNSRGDRQRAAAAFDAALPQPFERTAVNGFGFMQVVRRRERESLPELLRFGATGASARALLRQAQRVPGIGARELIASPEVIRLIEDHPHWVERLSRETGAAIRLRSDPARTIWNGHVQTVQS